MFFWVWLLKVPIHKWWFVFSFQKFLGSSFLSIGIEIHSGMSFLTCFSGYFVWVFLTLKLMSLSLEKYYICW